MTKECDATTYMFEAMADLALEVLQLMGQGSQAHGVEQEPTLTAGGTGGAGAGVAVAARAAASGDTASMASSLKGNLLLLSQDLDFGGREAQRSVGNRGCDGHLGPWRGGTCPCVLHGVECGADQSGCGGTRRTTGHDGRTRLGAGGKWWSKQGYFSSRSG